MEELSKEKNSPEYALEKARLNETVALAEKQLAEARKSNQENKSAIVSAKQELRENTSHSIGGLWSNEGFEALAALSQYVNPVTDKIRDYETTESKIRQLMTLIDSPYFARIDFKFDDEASDTFEKIYIGRASLMDEETYEMMVYDWRSPVAGVFYRFVTGKAYYDAPNGRITGEVGLKRQYEIRGGVLNYFFDADIQIVDEFLRKLLSQNASPTMKTVVETIQKEQDIVIRDMENELLMVQGVAGSGKTSVALHRAAYLMYQGLSAKLSAENILIISPNSLFEKYIENVLPELGEDHVLSAVPEEIFAKILGLGRVQSRNQFLEAVIASPDGPLKTCLTFKTSEMFKVILDRFADDLPRRFIAFKDIYAGGAKLFTKESLREKLMAARKETPLGLRLKQLEELILETLKEMAKASGIKPDYGAVKKEIRLFTEPDAQALYAELFNDDDYFKNLAEGLALPENIDEILSFTRRNLLGDCLCYDDASALAYLQMKIYRNNPFQNIKQVVIDEAQDYYPLHFELFHLLFPTAKYTVLGDINQTLEKNEDASLYERISKILNKKKSSLVTLNKSFRCTNEILSFSRQLIGHDFPVTSFNRSGEKPRVYSAADEKALEDMVCEEINVCLEQGCQSVGLIVKTEKNAAALYDRLKDRVDINIIKNGTSAEPRGIFVIPVYLSKGLEFDAVLVCDADDENYVSPEDKKLFYIAATRALHRLNLFAKGRVSRFLCGFLQD